MESFHLAFPVNDLGAAKIFYVDSLGCRLGRVTERSLIFNFYGHQLVAHLVEGYTCQQVGMYPQHFGIVFKSHQEWLALYERIKDLKLTIFADSFVRFPGTFAEHSSFFVQDPSGNRLEFKHYTNQDAIFG